MTSPQSHAFLTRVLGRSTLISISFLLIFNRASQAQVAKTSNSVDRAVLGKADVAESKRFYEGRVVDKSTGKPIVGARIVAEWLVVGRKIGEGPASKAETGVDGAFRLGCPFEDWPQSSDYIIKVDSPGYVSAFLTGAAFIDKENLEDYKKRLERTLNREIDEPKIGVAKHTDPKDSIGLVLKSIALRPGKVVSGRLVDRGGKPLVGYEILSRSFSKDRDENDPSLNQAYSDRQGRFRIVAPAGDRLILLIRHSEKNDPNDDDISSFFRILASEDDGDLGDINPEDKVAIRGRLVDQNGRPIVRHPVGARIAGGIESTSSDIAVMFIENECDVVRNTSTDDHGEFTLAPLPPGTYIVEPRKQRSHQRKFRVSLPPADPATPPVVEHEHVAFDELVYLPIVTILDPARPPAPITFKPIPHVVVEARLIRLPKAKPIEYTPAYLSIRGKFGDNILESNAYPKNDGSIKTSVARDMTDVAIILLSDPRSALRHRFTGEKNWSNDRLIFLNNLIHDIKGIEIVESAAATINVKVSSSDLRWLENLKVSATYPRGRSPIETIKTKLDPAAHDVEFWKSEAGVYFTHEIIPDEDLTITAEAEGYEPATQTVNLKEGEDRAVEFVLKIKAKR